MSWLRIGLLATACLALSTPFTSGEPQPERAEGKGNPLPAGAIARLGVARFQNVGRVFSVAFSPDGKTLAAASWDGSIRLWEVATRKELRQWVAHEGWVKSVAFSPDGKTLASGGNEPEIRLWEAATGKPIRQLAGHERRINFVAFSPDGKFLASNSDDSTLRLWDVTNGRELRRFKLQIDSNISFAFSPDSRILASASRFQGRQRTISLREVATGKELHEFVGQRSSFGAIAFSPDGKTLASGALHDERIRFWDVATGQDLRPLEMQEVEVTSLVFSPGGKTLASAGGSNIIYVWDVATRQERCRFVGVERGPVCLAFAPDGRVLASGSTDTTMLLWDLTGRLQNGQLLPISLSGEELQRLWSDLEGNDARKAHRALWQLVAAAAQSVPFIQKHLPPARAADPQQVARLIQDLDSDRFAVRQKAVQELEKLGEAAEPALRQVLLQKGLVLEVRRRVEQLLEQIVEKLPPVPRALEVLEHIGTPEARQVLVVLAQGVPEARLTHEAKAALGRLARRPAAAP